MLGREVLDTLELGLEVQGVSHLVEEEGEEEVTPVFVELDESGLFVLVDRVAKAVALDHDVSHGAKHDSCEVEVTEPPVISEVVLDLLANVSDIVLIVGDVVEDVDPCVKAFVHILVVLVELRSNLELQSILVAVS